MFGTWETRPILPYFSILEFNDNVIIPSKLFLGSLIVCLRNMQRVQLISTRVRECSRARLCNWCLSACLMGDMRVSYACYNIPSNSLTSSIATLTRECSRTKFRMQRLLACIFVTFLFLALWWRVCVHALLFVVQIALCNVFICICNLKSVFRLNNYPFRIL